MTVSDDDLDDNLFPSRLPPPSGTEHHFVSLEESSERVRHGYPICWSQKGYEWYPYLPAVVDFRHSIFRGMSRQPDIIYDGSTYRLNAEQMALWQNIEFVMVTVSKATGSGHLVSLEHREPHPPSSYGYTRSHSQLKFARKCVLKSLNAFQRLLAYCSYSITQSGLSSTLGPYARFYSDSLVSEFYNKFDPQSPDLHILAKLLLSTLWKMRCYGNYTGVVINYDDDYDYVAVTNMFHSNVPIYVAWPGPNINPYENFRQHHHLKDFIPNPELFKALESPPTLQPAAVPTLPAIRYGVPPAPHVATIYDHPTDYVKKRLQEIPNQLETSPNKQSMLGRLASARRFSGLGRAKLFRFDSITVTDEETGQEKVRWTRTLLTKHEAKQCFDDVDTSSIWYALFISSPPPLY